MNDVDILNNLPNLFANHLFYLVMEKRMDKAILYTTQMTKKADIITRDHSTTDFVTEKVMKLPYLHMHVKYPIGNTTLPNIFTSTLYHMNL